MRRGLTNIAAMRRFETCFLSLGRSTARTVAASAVLLGLGLSSVAASAQTQDPGQDEVTLKSGGSIRGTVVVSEPGKSVKIVVAGEAQPRVIPWSEVDQVEKGKYVTLPVSPEAPAPLAPPPAPPPPPGPSAPPPALKLGEPGVVRVHIDSPVPVKLIHQYDVLYPVVESWVDGLGNIVTRGAMAPGTERDVLCTAPCDRLTNERNLHIAGNGFPSSPTFDFSGLKGDVTVHVRPGNSAAYGSGIAAMVLGSLAAVAGAIVLPLNEANGKTTDRNTGVTVKVPDSALRAEGIGLVVGGVVAVVGGVALYLVGRTRVAIEADARAVAGVRPRYWVGEF
jgi:hypothetical protein